jgi:hypothetical protein
MEEKKEEEKWPELVVLVKTIDVKFALAMHEGQKLAENRDHVIGLKYDERDMTNSLACCHPFP